MQEEEEEVKLSLFANDGSTLTEPQKCHRKDS
jgi:hypothetical protein